MGTGSGELALARQLLGQVPQQLRMQLPASTGRSSVVVSTYRLNVQYICSNVDCVRFVLLSSAAA